MVAARCDTEALPESDGWRQTLPSVVCVLRVRSPSGTCSGDGIVSSQGGSCPGSSEVVRQFVSSLELFRAAITTVFRVISVLADSF